MIVRILQSSSVPISRQIADQVRAQVLSGRAPAGAALPSVRHLAMQLSVNPNTVLRVYEQLAAEQLIELRHGEGTFVSGNPPTARLRGYRLLLAEECDHLLHRGWLLGFTMQELREMCEESLRHLQEQIA